MCPGSAPSGLFALDNTTNKLYNMYIQLEVGQEVWRVPEGKSYIDAAFRGHGRGS